MSTRLPSAWSERLRTRWTFLTSRYLVVSSLPMLVAQTITSVLGLTRNAVLAQTLSKDEYGALNYLLSGLSVVALLGLPGLSVAVAQYAAKGHWEAIRLGLRRRLFFAFLPMLALVAVAMMGAHSGQREIIPSHWLLTALFYPTAQVLTPIGGILGALKRFRTLAWFRVGQSAVFLWATMIGLWAWPGEKTTGIILFQWLLLSMLNACFWKQLQGPETEPVPLSLTQRSQFYRFGTHMTILTAMSQLRTHLGPLLLGSFISLSALADYSIGELFLRQMRGLWNIYGTVSYPRLLELNARDRWKQVGREARLATPLFLVLSVAGGLALSFVVPWLFSAKYASSVAYVWIMLLAFACSIPGGFFEMYFRVEESEHVLYRTHLISDVLGILLPPLSLVLWGPLGVPAGRAGASLAYSFVGYMMYRAHRPEAKTYAQTEV